MKGRSCLANLKGLTVFPFGLFFHTHLLSSCYPLGRLPSLECHLRVKENKLPVLQDIQG